MTTVQLSERHSERERAWTQSPLDQGAPRGKVLIWDAPIRVFHWLFAASCTAAFVLAVVGEESRNLFALHMIFGIAAVFLLVMRIAIGIVGARHNRLDSMLFSPRETVAYLVGVVTGRGRSYPVHNPATSWLALALYVMVPILMWTGVAPEREAADELHVILGYGLPVLIAAHLCGLAVYSLRHRENVSLAMVTGRKRAPAAVALTSARWTIGAVLLVASLVWIGCLFASYSPSSGTVVLPIVGVEIGVAAGDAGQGPGRDE